jgi:hypothetical protein
MTLRCVYSLLVIYRLYHSYHYFLSKGDGNALTIRSFTFLDDNNILTFGYQQHFFKYVPLIFVLN